MSKPRDNTKKSWQAMIKFANDEPMSRQNWEDLSWLSLINRNNLAFEPGNIRWATTKAERESNLAFYKSLGAPQPIH